MGNQGVTPSDPHVARGQFALVVRLIGKQDRQAQRSAGRLGQVAAVGGHPLPTFGVAEALQLSRQRVHAIEQPEVGAEFSGVRPEQY